jgi:hypothetical protein
MSEWALWYEQGRKNCALKDWHALGIPNPYSPKLNIMATKKEGGGKSSGIATSTAGGTAGGGSKSTSAGKSGGGKASGGMASAAKTGKPKPGGGSSKNK